MAQSVSLSYAPIQFTPVDGTTTAAYWDVISKEVNAINKFSLIVPAGLTVSISITFDLPANATSTWTEVDTGITNQTYNYSANSCVGIRIVRTAGSGVVKGIATEGGTANSITSIIPGTGATSLGKAEDSPHASGDVGVFVLVVRNDAGGNMVNTDGDYAPLQVDSTGNLRVSLASLPALAAGTNLIGKISASLETSTIYDGSTALTPKFAFANVAASQTDSNIVSAVGGKKIRVHQVAAVAGGTAVNLTFNSKPGGAGTAISPLFANAANGGEVLAFSPMGWFQTTTGEGLTVTTGAGSTTGILVGYTEV